MNGKFANTKTEQFEKLTSNIGKIESTLQKRLENLESFEDIIDQLPKQYEALEGEEERQAFHDSYADLLSELDEKETATEILTLREKLIKSYEDPLIDSIQTTQLRLLDELDVTENNKLRQIINDTKKTDFEDTTAARSRFQELLNKINEVEDVKQELFVTYLKESPSQLRYPEELAQYLDQLDQQYTKLSRLEADLSGYDWWPEEARSIETQKEFYGEEINVEQALEDANQVTQAITTAEESPVPLFNVLQNQIIEEIENTEDISEFLSLLKSNCDTIIDYISALDDIASPLEGENDIEEYPNFLVQYQDISADSLSDLNQELAKIETSYFDWKADFKQRWEGLRSQILATAERFGDPPGKIADAVHEDDLIEVYGAAGAYKIFREGVNWLEEQQASMGEELSGEAAELFNKIVDEGSVSVSEDDMDALKELISIVDLKVEFDD